MKTLLFQCLIILPVWCLIDPRSTPNTDSELQRLKNEVQQMREKLESLQSQSQIQEQKYSAVLQSVLSKLTSTTDELLTVKQKLTETTEELTELRGDHNASQTELQLLQEIFKAHRSSSEANITSIGHMLSGLESEFQMSNLSTVRSDVSNLKSVISIMDTHLSLFGSNMTSLKSELTTIRDQVTVTTRNLTLMDADHKEYAKKLESVEYEVSQLTTHLNMTSLNVNQLKTALQNISTIIGKDKGYVGAHHSGMSNTTKNTVIFQASQTGDISVVQHNEMLLKLNNTTINGGQGYNASTGIFTAPVTGMYIFWANINYGSIRNFKLSLFKNGQREASVVESSHGDDERILHAMFVMKGDQVWCQVEGDHFRISGLAYASFGGILVHADGSSTT